MKRITHLLIFLTSGMILLSSGCEKKPPSSLKPEIGAFTDNSVITSFAKDGNKIWIGSYGELRSYDFERKILLKRYKFAGELFLSRIYQIEIMAGRVWVATDVGLFGLEESTDRWEVFLCGKELPAGGVEAIDIDYEGKGIWLGIRKSMHLGESGDIRLGYLDLRARTFRGIKINSDFIGKLVATKDDVWFFTRYYGGEERVRLIRIDRKGLTSALADGLKDEGIFGKGKDEYSYKAPNYVEGITPTVNGGLAALLSIGSFDLGKQSYKYELKLFGGREITTLALPVDARSLIRGDSGKNLWVLGNKTIYRYTGKDWKTFHLGDFSGKGHLVGIVEHKGTDYLVRNIKAGDEGASGIFTFSGERVIDLSEYRELSGGFNFWVFLKDSQGNIWTKSDYPNHPEIDVSKFNEKSNTWEYMNRKIGIRLSDHYRVDKEIEYITEYLDIVRLWVSFDDNENKISGIKIFNYSQEGSTLTLEPELSLKLKTTQTTNDALNINGSFHRISVIKETNRDIWVITADGRVGFYDKGKKGWEIYPEALSRLCVFEDTGIWFALGGGKSFSMAFLRFDDKKVSFIDFSKTELETDKDLWLSGIAGDKKAIWLGLGRYLIRFDAITKTISNTYFLKDMEEYGIIRHIVPYREKYLVLGITSTYEDVEIKSYLWLFDKETGEYFDTNLSQYLRGLSLEGYFPQNRFIIEGEHLWLGASHGVFKVDMRSLLKSANAAKRN